MGTQRWWQRRHVRPGYVGGRSRQRHWAAFAVLVLALLVWYALSQAGGRSALPGRAPAGQARSAQGHMPPSRPRPVHVLQAWVTGYDLSGITATGATAGPGVCAVDPGVIPLGARITIDGYGTCTAADTGAAVVGATIDIWVPNYQMALSLTGRHTIRWN